MRIRAAVCALPLSAVIVVSTAAASGASIHVSPSNVHRGHTVRVYGSAPGCSGPVTLLSQAFVHTHEFAGVPAVYANVGQGGAYSVNTKIPAGRAPAHYVITGRCGGGNLGVSAALHVLS